MNKTCMQVVLRPFRQNGIQAMKFGFRFLHHKLKATKAATTNDQQGQHTDNRLFFIEQEVSSQYSLLR